jgi:hypothetical protein
MSRRPLRTHGRRFALGLTLMLVAGAIAVPAFASTAKTFSVDTASDFEECLTRTQDGDCATGAFDFTVTFKNTSDRDLSWFSIASPVAPYSDPAPAASAVVDAVNVVGSVRVSGNVLETTFLEPKIAAGGEADLTFRGTGTCGATAQFSGAQAQVSYPGTGDGVVNTFVLATGDSLQTELICFDPLADFEEDEIVRCDDEPSDTCEITVEGGMIGTQTFTASVEYTEGAAIGLRIVNAAGGSTDIGADVARAVNAACDTEVAKVRAGRLGEAVIHLVPVGFEDNQVITIVSTVPKAYVNTSTNRSAGSFQVCFAGEQRYAGPRVDQGLKWFDLGNELQKLEADGGGPTGLYGPKLLLDCTSSASAGRPPCVVSKAKNTDSDVVLTYQIPAEDPWGR